MVRLNSKYKLTYKLIVAVVIVYQAEFGVVVFAAPLDGLGDIALSGDGAVGIVFRRDVLSKLNSPPCVKRHLASYTTAL